jgi:hypothetical protein
MNWRPYVSASIPHFHLKVSEDLPIYLSKDWNLKVAREGSDPVHLSKGLHPIHEFKGLEAEFNLIVDITLRNPRISEINRRSNVTSINIEILICPTYNSPGLSSIRLSTGCPN